MITYNVTIMRSYCNPRFLRENNSCRAAVCAYVYIIYVYVCVYILYAYMCVYFICICVCVCICMYISEVYIVSQNYTTKSLR